MAKYHQQNMKLSQRDEELEKAIKDRAQELNRTAELEQDDEQGAFAGCVTDHVQTAMEELVAAHSTATKHQESSDLQEQYKSLNKDQKELCIKYCLLYATEISLSTLL